MVDDGVDTQHATPLGDVGLTGSVRVFLKRIGDVKANDEDIVIYETKTGADAAMQVEGVVVLVPEPDASEIQEGDE